MNSAYWMTNKFTNHSSVLIHTRENTARVDLFGETIEDHIMSLANVIASYGLTTVKTDKEYLVFEAPLNALLAQNYNYQNGVKLEEV